MIFSGLADRLQETFKRLKTKGKLSEKDVKVALREVKMALLEADVNFKVVRDFVKAIEERAIGHEVMESLSPAQQVIKIVKEELTHLMGGEQKKITISSTPPTIVMLCGLQGSGKTTTIAKLARYYHRQGRSPLMVAADIYRPAAIKQLQVLGEQLNLPVFSMGDKKKPEHIAAAGVENAKQNGLDMVLIDTAGRLHIDSEMMKELVRLKERVRPHENLLVVDAMTGQDAVNVALSFNEELDIDGVILTKMDGDARGGAALSVKSVTGAPIKFVGMGEKLDNLEPFHPDRLSSRILGMGDVLSLIEKAESALTEKKAQEMEERLRKNAFTLDDFLEQLKQIRNMGSLDEILGMIPGMGQLKQLKNMQLEEKEMDRVEAIINSMTLEEKRRPEIIKGSRRKRIARGSGTRVQDVNRILNQFKQTTKLMKRLNKMEKKGMKMGSLPFFK